MDWKTCAVIVVLSIVVRVWCQDDCPAILSRLEPGRSCRKSCTSNKDCKGALKKCLCDNICGMTCYNPSGPCPLTEQVPHASVMGPTEPTYGQSVTYKCESGYILNGTSTRTCRADKKMSGTLPSCYAGCTLPKRVGNAYPDSFKNEYQVDEELKYVCRFGYFITGSPFVRCQEGGQWTNPRFRCDRKDCKEPPTPDNAYKEGNDFLFGSRVYFYCNKGYEMLERQNFITCGTRGTWRGNLPTCEVVSCLPPVPPAMGSVDDSASDYTYNTHVQYSCQRGYKLKGPVRGTCNENATWGEVPVCVVDKDCNFEDFNRPFCGFTNERSLWKRTFSSDVPVGPRGFLVATNFDTHHDVNERAILSSPLVSRESSICFKFYYKLKKIRHAGNFQIKIENGRHLWKPTTVAIKDEWLSTDIKFRAAPGLLSFVVQFIAIKGSSTSPTEIEIDEIELSTNDSCENECQKKTCRNGGKCLNLIGGYRCVCTPRYIGKNCETALTCRVPQPPLHGFVSPTSGTDVFIKEIIRFNCGLDYKLFGSFSSTCIRRRTWSSVVPYCRRKCPYQHASERVFVKGRKQVNTEGDQVNYSCKARSMTLIGSSTSKCQSSGQWSNKSPICKRQCSLPTPPTGVSIKETRNDYFDNDVIIFSCNRPDLVLRGEKSSRCLTNGQWSAPIPRCLRLCSARDVPAGITIQSQIDAYAAGDQVTFTCQQGFNLIGSSTSTCRNDGQWSSVVPECRVPVQGNVTLTKKQPDCPAGYIKQSPLCYKVIHSLFNHADATAECEADGATLPVIRNSEMESLLKKIARKHTIESYWLGLSKPQNLWQWADGIQYNRNDYKNFRSGAYASYGCYYVSVYGGWRWRECWRTRQTLCIKWEEAVKPLKVKAIPNTSNVQEYNGIYQPVYGVVHGGAAFYDQQISVIARYSIYYINDGDRWYIGKTRPTSNNHRHHIYANSFVTYPQKVNEQLWNSDFVSFREMSIKAFEVWSEWSLWSECPSSCGYSYRNRNRSCLMDSDSVLCFAKSSERVSCRNPCPLAIGNSSYKVYSGERVNFMKAREICKQNNGDLAMIKKHETQANLLKEIKKLSEQSYFIGLTRHNSDKWCWVDGQQVNVGGSNMEGYSHWRSREPNNWEGVEACGSLYPNDQGKWSDINCNRSQSFICENQLNLCISTPCANGSKCEGTSSFYKCLCNTNTSGKRCENNFHCQLPETQNILETDIGNRSGINVGESIIYKGSGAVKRKYKYVCNDDGLSDAVLLQCPFLSDLENGKIVWDAIGQNQPGSTVSFVCDEGYVLQGVSNLFCTAGFQWTSNMPLCAEAPIQQQPCPNLTYPQNGKIEFSSNGNQYHVGSQASFSCKEGYRLNGASKLICQNDSKWNFRKPVCEEALPSQPTPLPQQQHCPNLAAPTNGSLTFSVKVPKNQAGSEALFSCRQGFKLKGSKKLVCLFGREWSAQPPVCEARGCRIFRVPEGISINFIPGKEYRPGENVTFSCENSSEQIFDAVCVKNEQWNPPLTAERCS